MKCTLGACGEFVGAQAELPVHHLEFRKRGRPRFSFLFNVSVWGGGQMMTVEDGSLECVDVTNSRSLSTSTGLAEESLAHGLLLSTSKKSRQRNCTPFDFLRALDQLTHLQIINMNFAAKIRNVQDERVAQRITKHANKFTWNGSQHLTSPKHQQARAMKVWTGPLRK